MIPSLFSERNVPGNVRNPAMISQVNTLDFLFVVSASEACPFCVLVFCDIDIESKKFYPQLLSCSAF